MNSQNPAKPQILDQLIKPESGYSYHLIIGRWDGDTQYFEAVLPTPVDCTFAGYDSPQDQFRSKQALFDRNLLRGSTHAAAYVSFWFEFLNNFTAAIIDGNINHVIEDLSRLYYETTPKAFNVFMNFQGVLTGACFCIGPQSAMRRMDSSIAYKVDFPVLGGFNNPDTFKTIDRIYYQVLSSGARLVKITPYELLKKLFADIYKIDTLPDFGFSNPFAQILFGNVNADAFLNARRCLTDEGFNSALNENKAPVIPSLALPEKISMEKVEEMIKAHLQIIFPTIDKVAWLEKLFVIPDNYHLSKYFTKTTRNTLLGISRKQYSLYCRKLKSKLKM